MKKMRCAQLSLCLVVLTAASCGFPRLSEIADGGGANDGPTDDGAPPHFSLDLLAGDIGGPGNGDGICAEARFRDPSGVAVDSAGDIYVADQGNHTIRKVTPTGVVTTLAGAGLDGSDDGTGAAARFYYPTGVVVDSAGNVYVADQENSTIRKVTPAGMVTTLAGGTRTLGSADGTGAAARFNRPRGVAVDSAGNVYVADSGNNTIRKVTAAGVVTTLAGVAGMAGSSDGASAAARFNYPTGVAVDSVSNVYVTDSGNNTLRKVTANGVVTTLAGTAGMSGGADGMGATARFASPGGVAVDSAGNLYVVDGSGHTLRKVTANGVVTTLAGTAFISGSVDGTGAAARFFQPAGVAVDGAGNIYVADLLNSTLRKVTSDRVVTTLAGAVSMAGSADSTGAAARFHDPSGVAVDSADNIYVTDTFNATLRKVTTGGVVTTLAGTAGMTGSVDGRGAAALFSAPYGTAVDSAGNIYVTGNNTIRKVTAAGVVTTLAGTAGMAGSTDGIGADARFSGPGGVAVDSADNIYVSDNRTIRKVTLAGVVTTLAGTAGVIGGADGTGADARFYDPAGVAVDSAGNVYVADTSNSNIRKVTPAGVVTTLAGAGFGRVDGTGADARFGNPTSVAVDSAGNVYVADTGNSTIRKVTPTGTTTTVAGTFGVAGILLGATPRFAFPRSLAIVGDSIVISDANAILLLRHGAQ